MILLLNKSFLYSWGWIRSWQATTLMTSQRRWSQILKKPFLCFGFLVFTVPVGWFHNARLRRIMILNNFLTLRWSWTSWEATWRGSRGVRRSQPLARRWYQGGTSLSCCNDCLCFVMRNKEITRTCCLYHLFPSSRCKPFKYTYEKEIVMYAYFKKLDYFSTECIYSPNAYRF